MDGTGGLISPGRAPVLAPVCAQTSKLKAARATQRLQEMVSESGACGELTVAHVPLPLDPSILLTGQIPAWLSK